MIFPGRASLTTAPATTAVALATAKAYLKLDDTSDDTIVGVLLSGVEAMVESYVGRALITQTWDYWLDISGAAVSSVDARMDAGWPVGTAMSGELSTLELPRPPLQTVTYIKYYDSLDAEHTFSADDYTVDTAWAPGRVRLLSGSSWPSDLRARSSIVVRYVAGYGAAATDVPAGLQAGILDALSYVYGNRGEHDATGARANALPATSRRLLDSYKWSVL